MEAEKKRSTDGNLGRLKKIFVPARAGQPRRGTYSRRQPLTNEKLCEFDTSRALTHKKVLTLELSVRAGAAPAQRGPLIEKAAAYAQLQAAPIGTLRIRPHAGAGTPSGVVARKFAV